jgi:hypothetical protein
MRARRPHEFKRQAFEFIGTSTMTEVLPYRLRARRFIPQFILNHDFGYIETSRVSLVAGSL